MDYFKEALKLHEQWQGKIRINAAVPIRTKEDLSLAYTPGVAAPCLEIEKDIDKSYLYTLRGNLCLVVTDGSAVLGLGDIGPEAGMPVMEGKCLLFKEFGGIDAFPLCIKSHDVDEIVNTISLISGSFGGINLEDISAPRCFEIEEKLKERLDIPVFHDDQHGTAIVVLSGLINALKIVEKEKEDVKIVINGAGSAGIAITKLLLKYGFKNIILSDIEGTLCADSDRNMNPYQAEIAKRTNPDKIKGSLKDAIKGADIFIGVSAPDILTEEMVSTMNRDAVIFACANPVPEISPEKALNAGAKIVATGRSDFPNQINNLLAFPGVFKGTFQVRAKEINDEMKLAAAKAIANLISEDELTPEYIIPPAFDRRVVKVVAEAVADEAVKTGVAQIK